MFESDNRRNYKDLIRYKGYEYSRICKLTKIKTISLDDLPRLEDFLNNDSSLIELYRNQEELRKKV